MADDTYTDEMESWLGDGLPTDFEGTIANAKFAIPVDSQADDPQPMLIIDIENAEFDMDEQRIGIGKGWVAQDKGARVEREDGGKLVYNKQSKIGRLLGSLMESADFRAALTARATELGRMPTPFEAEFWNGITGTWVRETGSFKNTEGEEIEFSFWTVTDPTVKTKKASGASGPAKKATKKAASSRTSGAQSAKEKALAAKKAKEQAEQAAAEETDKAPSSNGTGPDTSNPVIAQLVELATAADDHDAFVIEAYTQIDEADLTDEVTALIDDPDALYNTVGA